ncbi:hypothetical protein [Synechococcus phage BUCT-ZZ01]|nr:hypothetical protein [Synechococcus phage BUCT-ZZ01]
MSGACEECWNHICTCGFQYGHLTDKQKQRIILAIANKDVLLLQRCIDQLDAENLPKDE